MPAIATEVRRPQGYSAVQAWDPVEIGLHPLRDWARATQMELGERFKAIKSDNIRKMFEKYARTNAQNGTPGAPIPLDPKAARYTVVGDFGDGSEVEKQVFRQVSAIKSRALLTVGDNVYPTGREVDWKRGWDDIGYAGYAKSTRVMPALGNHDYYRMDLRPYFNRFPHLNNQAYYSWSDGLAQFFALDTEQHLEPSSAQGAWLDGQLRASKAPFKIVYLHRPIWNSAGVEPDVAARLQSNLGPVLAQHGVQLVISGHEHSYERSQAIEGVTYITTGGGGAELRPFRADQPAWSAYRKAVHNFLTLDVTKGALIVRALDQDGKVFDTARIPQRPQAMSQSATAARLISAAS